MRSSSSTGQIVKHFSECEKFARAEKKQRRCGQSALMDGFSFLGNQWDPRSVRENISSSRSRLDDFYWLSCSREITFWTRAQPLSRFVLAIREPLRRRIIMRVLESRSRFQNFTFLPVCSIPREIRRIVLELRCSNIKSVSPILVARDRPFSSLCSFLFLKLHFMYVIHFWKVRERSIGKSAGFPARFGKFLKARLSFHLLCQSVTFIHIIYRRYYTSTCGCNTISK